MATMRTPQQVIAQTLVDRLGPNVTLPRAIVENLAFDAIACVEALEAEGYAVIPNLDPTLTEAQRGAVERGDYV